MQLPMILVVVCANKDCLFSMSYFFSYGSWSNRIENQIDITIVYHESNREWNDRIESALAISAEKKLKIQNKTDLSHIQVIANLNRKKNH